jgi:hypothetical protein
MNQILDKDDDRPLTADHGQWSFADGLYDTNQIFHEAALVNRLSSMVCYYLYGMKRFLLIALAVAASFTYYSCKKDKKKGCMDPLSLKYDSEAQEDDGSCTYGGTGGNVTIVAKPQHHLMPITNKPGYPDSAFVKFNTKNSPGTHASDYDLVIAGEDPVTPPGEDHVHIPNLKPGYYYIYMTGWDSTQTQLGNPAGARVSGGTPVTITASSGEVEEAIPVTE